MENRDKCVLLGVIPPPLFQFKIAIFGVKSTKIEGKKIRPAPPPPGAETLYAVVLDNHNRAHCQRKKESGTLATERKKSVTCMTYIAKISLISCSGSMDSPVRIVLSLASHNKFHTKTLLPNLENL